jgi:DnaJ family protein C protein 11
MSITLDARGVFLPESRFDNPEEYDHSVVARLQRTQVGQVLLKHSFETPISERTQFVMEGQMAAMRGAGGANLSGTIKHQFSPRLWMQATQTILAPHITSVKGTYTFDEFTYVTGTAIQQTWLAPPRLSVTLGRKLYEETTGFVSEYFSWCDQTGKLTLDQHSRAASSLLAPGAAAFPSVCCNPTSRLCPSA